MPCSACKGRKTQVDVMTRQLIVCPVCRGASDTVRPNPALAHLALYGALRETVAAIGPRSYLEIGVREGDSLATILHADIEKHIRRVALCDTWGSQYGGTARGSHAHIMDVFLQVRYAQKIEFYDGDSRETVPTIEGAFDLILIDGDHSYPGAMTDLLNAVEILSPGGRLIMDDVMHPDHLYLRECVDNFVAENGMVIEKMITAPTGVAILKAGE